MTRKALTAIIGILFLVCGGALPALSGEMDNVKSELIYGAFVDNYIRICEAKSDMLDSRSPHIRKDAMRATLKGAFMRSNRDAVIEYLMENEVPFNAHRIQYHLSLRFTESVNPHTSYALLLKEKTGEKNTGNYPM